MRQNAGLFAIGVLLRSEEHTSELQSQSNLVCRLLLEKKKNKITESSDGDSKALQPEVLGRKSRWTCLGCAPLSGKEYYMIMPQNTSGTFAWRGEYPVL